METPQKIIPHNKIYNDLPKWSGKGHDYLREYQKKKWFCQTCVKEQSFSNKYKHLKTEYHLKRCS